MKEHVSWVIELAVKPGQLDSFKELMEEMVAGTNTEPETLNYEWYISADHRPHLREVRELGGDDHPRQRLHGEVGGTVHGAR